MINKLLPALGILICCAYWGCQVAAAQTVVVNDKGERILIHPDGTIEYLDKPLPADSTRAPVVSNKPATTRPGAKPPRTQPAPTRPGATTGSPYEIPEKPRRQGAAKPKPTSPQPTASAKPARQPKPSKSKPSPKQQRRQEAEVEEAVDKIAVTPAPVPTPTTPATAEKPKKEKRPTVVKAPCQYAYDEVDPYSKRRRRGLAEKRFFAYTPDNIKSMMQGDDFMVCTGSLTETTGLYGLNLTFTFDSPKVRASYGPIEINSTLQIQMLDGNTVTLLAAKTDYGRIENGKTVYQTFYVLGKNDRKALMKSEVNRVRMMWGAGYEEYEVFEMDFFASQLPCLN